MRGRSRSTTPRGAADAASAEVARYVDDRARREVVDRVERLAVVVEGPADVPPATRDPRDGYLVALARAQRVDAIVTADRDLLDTAMVEPSVWTPREVITRLAPAHAN
jgi:predicted nucleic acid-binding protein